MWARLNIDCESCFRAHVPKLEQARLLNLDTFGNYTTLLVGPEHADFDWKNLLALAQHRNMKIKRGPDGSLPLTKFCPPVAAAP